MRDEDRDLAFAFADGGRDLRRRQDQPSRSVEHEVQRHLGIRHHAGADDVLGIVDVDVAHQRESEQAHRLLPVNEQDDARLALPLEARQQALARVLEKSLLDHRLQR